MDATCRELLRAWRRDPTDAVAADACADALHRARVELPWELIPALSRWSRPLRLVARFAAAPPTEADGLPEREVLAAEARLGLRLPVALREWYRVVGRWSGAPQLRGSIVPPSALALVDGLLVVRSDVELEVRASVREADLDQPDPPLLIELDRRSETARLGARVSTYLAVLMANELAAEGPWAATVRSGFVDYFHDPFRRLDDRLERAGYRSWYTEGVDELLLDDWLYEDEDTLVSLDETGAARVHIRARTPEAWARAAALAAGGG